jgi:hypothetical protein
MSGTRIRIRVNEEVIFNGTIKNWASKPPDVFRDAIKPEIKPEPYLKGVLVAMADAVQLERSCDIDVITGKDFWQMRVTEK